MKASNYIPTPQAGVEVLWSQVLDLLEKESPAGVEGRLAAWEFLQKLVEGQGQRLYGPMRTIAFRTIIRSYKKEDLASSLALFSALTDSGRESRYFESEVGTFMLRIFPDVLNTDKTAEFLKILVTVIKFNTAYLDSPLISSYIGFVKFNFHFEFK